MEPSQRPPEPSAIVALIAYGLSLYIVGYGFYWLYQQLEKWSFWVNYIKIPFFVIMGIGLVGVLFLYGMAGLAMYKSGKEMSKRYKPEEEEEEP